MVTFAAYMDEFDSHLRAYIPPGHTWTPPERALYGPRNLLEVPAGEAEVMRFEAIRFAFGHHYTNNATYRRFCQERGVCPADLRTPDDLDRIPLISHRFFKEYPSGRDMATWLANVHTGALPRIVVKGRSPTFDQVVNAFNAAGLEVAHSSGTGGRHTLIPRDRRTFQAAEYAIAKSAAIMLYPGWDYATSGYLLMPNPRKTNVFAGRVCQVYFDAIQDVQVAIDRPISADVMRIVMSGQKGLRGTIVRLANRLSSARLVDRIVLWLEHHATARSKVALVGAPYILWAVMNKLRQQGKSFDFGERGAVLTGGGWKVYEGSRMPVADFRRVVEEVLGIPQQRCLDLYGMVEGNGWMIHCPEGHYLHAPYTYYKPLVLDEESRSLGYGQWGRFAFLDAAALSYPGFILTGDVARLLQHCPVCDRPGPVLEPEVRRASGEEMRGCGEEVRRMVTADMGG